MHARLLVWVSGQFHQRQTDTKHQTILDIETMAHLGTLDSNRSGHHRCRSLGRLCAEIRVIDWHYRKGSQSGL